MATISSIKQAPDTHPRNPGIPAGLRPFDLRVKEIEASVAVGANEIDIVVTCGHVLTRNWQALYDEVKTFSAVAGEAHFRAILGTGGIATLCNVAKASMIAMMAGADYIETSTRNMKRSWVNNGRQRNWFDIYQGEGREFLHQATRIKNIWIPYGD